MAFSILTIELKYEQDVVSARQRARQIAGLLGMDMQDQTRVATAVSEIARNAFRYGARGTVIFSVEKGLPPILWTRINDHGKGIKNLSDILDGSYQSATGMGMGIMGARRLMDHFEIQSSAQSGTQVALGKILNTASKSFGSEELARVATALAASRAPEDAFSELRQQNTELLQALAVLQKREHELSVERARLSRLNQELEDTNRGVIALNMELEQNATALHRASEVKSSFLAHMTHEFRTPVNSILSLSRVLTLPSGEDVLSNERLKQVGFIRKAAESLSELVNDLLDTAKAEAGRLEVHSTLVEVSVLFGALRGMFKPLLSNEKPVDLIFVEPATAISLFTDEGKLAQILRNFISNALKFTDRGSVEVKAEIEDEQVVFSVKDTGIGISAANQKRVFEDFMQIEGPHQKVAHGTGLGLPLTRRLTLLLGGSISLESTLGEGSIFIAKLPLVRETRSLDSHLLRSKQPTEVLRRLLGSTPAGKILIIDDDAASRYMLRGMLKDTGYELIEATDGPTGIQKAIELRPVAIFLDVVMPGLNGLEVLETLKVNKRTMNIPVIINSSKKVSDRDFANVKAIPEAVLSKESYWPIDGDKGSAGH